MERLRVVRIANFWLARIKGTHTDVACLEKLGPRTWSLGGMNGFQMGLAGMELDDALACLLKLAERILGHR